MTTLFDYAARYPTGPGYKDRDTSRDAARAIAPDASRIRKMCLMALAREVEATADEVAAVLNLSVLTVRPRFTELSKSGAIVDTGLRSKNESGRSAKVWRVA